MNPSYPESRAPYPPQSQPTGAIPHPQPVFFDNSGGPPYPVYPAGAIPQTPPPSYNTPTAPLYLQSHRAGAPPNPFPQPSYPDRVDGPIMYGQPAVVTSPPVQPVIVALQPLGDVPTRTICPACQQHIVTSVKPTPGLITWLIFGGCLLFGLWLGCCLIPFCVDSLQDAVHTCPNCSHVISRYKRL